MRAPVLLYACLLAAVPAAGQINVLTYRNDTARTGQNLSEPLLSPANVNAAQFGQRFTQPVDGSIFAQPLYMTGVPMADGIHDIILVATEHDSVYAFDAADNQGPDASALWQVSYIHPSQGVTSVPWQDTNCPVIYPELGITGTPVIDAATYTIYFVTFTKEIGGDGTAHYVHRLHALDVRSGQELAASPVEIQASVAGTGDGGTQVTFNPASYKQRAALLLANGMVYIGWSSHCDLGLYHGWIMAYDAATLQQTAVYNTTPNGISASFWGAGAGPAADADGNLFVVSANGTFDDTNSPPDLGDSVIKLRPDLSLVDYYTPANQLFLSDYDLDLGSSGAVLLPAEAGSATHPNLLITGGKEGRILLVDRDSLGKQTFQDRGLVQGVASAVQSIYAPPAYFAGRVYLSGAGDQLKVFGIANGTLTAAPVSHSAASFASPGSAPVISANGTANGIVWALELGGGAGELHAFDAGDLSNELFHDSPGSYVQFAAPTVAGSRVYVPTLDSLVVYGLLPVSPRPASAAAMAAVSAASFNPPIAPGSLISIFGSGLARGTASALAIPLPASLADTSVFVNGARAPLLYVSPTQINAQLPAQTAPGAATLAVSVSGAMAAMININVAPVAPQIFMSSATRAFALDQDSSVNTDANPAAAGSIVTVFVTGHAQMADPEAFVDGFPAVLAYAGPTPGTVGVGQMNLYLPALPPGDYPVEVSVGGVDSNYGLISVGR
jgi:uncharacterized protein (TIGR03437 family)